MDKDEVLRTIQVDSEKIVCKTCKHKNGGMQYPYYTKGSCTMYPSDEHKTKPKAVLFAGAECAYYEKED